ncbi:MAG: type II toxin-antitoxin system prevent-host-death family antitoxin [bacterium]
MTINTENLVSMAEANQNFSKVVRKVEDKGMVVVLKNNKPRFIVVDFDEYDDIQKLRQQLKEQRDLKNDSI